MASLPNLEDCKYTIYKDVPRSFLTRSVGLADSNDVFNISLVSPTPSGLQLVSTFNPSFTYSIFGEEQKIFGYKDFKINLRYRANDMRPHVQTSYSSKFTPIGETGPMDVIEMLKEDSHLPDSKLYRAISLVAHLTGSSCFWQSRRL